ncbi:cyclin-dependent kinase 7 isoform X2 [Egretta garzetta]|uniref:cyclin-dependent kinase 7 isoform X2 n=1 Tax=Egretta garzetta TaxID=188379 RepID=UPI00163C6D22|nr:cyclin-dependent kinase 7 isoform X2 [Egretta garzetta]
MTSIALLVCLGFFLFLHLLNCLYIAHRVFLLLLFLFSPLSCSGGTGGSGMRPDRAMAVWVLCCWLEDLKPNNLLLDENGVLKLADFGLAKSFGSPNRVYTHQVVTRWYRAPELLFGARMYGVGVDMWAVGCILAELLLRVPFLPGDSDLDQLTRIFETLGTPTEEQWPGMTSLPDYVTFKSFPGMPLQHIFSAAGDDLLNLLQGLFTFNPCTRVTATQALKQKYFSNRPGPTPGNQLPRPNCPAEAVKEQQNALLNLKRKRTEGIDQGLPKKLIF